MTSQIVIHTGPADRADRWIGPLGAAGFEVRLLPAIASTPVELSAEAEAEVAACAPYGMVVVTSPRAASSLSRLARWLDGADVAAVGAATAKACADAGFQAKWVGSSARRTFLEALGDRVAAATLRVLHPHGDLAEQPGLPELAGRGARVVAPVVYRTVVVPHAPAEVETAVAGATGVTFTSPSGVRSFVAAADAAGIATKARMLFAATLGPSTESAAQKSNFPWRGVARRPDAESLAHLLVSALRT